MEEEKLCIRFEKGGVIIIRAISGLFDTVSYSGSHWYSTNILSLIPKLPDAFPIRNGPNVDEGHIN